MTEDVGIFESEQPPAKVIKKKSRKKDEMPQHEDAEMALISSCFVDETGLTFAKALSSGIGKYSFYKNAHQAIWESMLDAHKNDKPINDVVIIKALADSGNLKTIGGTEYFNTVLDHVTSHSHAHHYINIVVETAARRGMKRSAKALIDGIDEGKPIPELEETIQKIDWHVSNMDAGQGFSLTPLTNYKRPPAESPDRLIGKHRYICRGGGAMFVGSAGIGKSFTSTSLAISLVSPATSPSNAAARAEMTSLVESAVATMDDIDQEIIALRHFEQLSNSEISAVLEISQKAASIRYVRALTELREVLSRWPGLLEAFGNG